MSVLAVTGIAGPEHETAERPHKADARGMMKLVLRWLESAGGVASPPILIAGRLLSTVAGALVAGRLFARAAWTGGALVYLVFWPGLERLSSAPYIADGAASHGPTMAGPQNAHGAYGTESMGVGAGQRSGTPGASPPTAPNPPDSAGAAARRDAVEQVLVTLRSDPEGGIEHTLLLGFDAERRVERLVRRTGDDFETFSFEQTRNGATLASAGGRDVVRLSCPACDSRLGGRVRIRYLSNGIFNSYDVLELDCRRGADDMVALFPLGGDQPIRRLRMTSRTFLGILIGIGAIQVER